MAKTIHQLPSSIAASPSDFKKFYISYDIRLVEINPEPPHLSKSIKQVRLQIETKEQTYTQKTYPPSRQSGKNTFTENFKNL